jgi:hypothetical protein
MSPIRLDEVDFRPSRGSLLGSSERFVDAREFHALMVSHRRMVRQDKGDNLLRGLRDLDSGEVFLIDERRLFEAKR